MKIKTFYAKSMQAALRQIKEQLGPDALILSSREFPPAGSGEAARGFEVVAAVDEKGFGHREPWAEVAASPVQKPAADRRDAQILHPEDTCSFSRLASDPAFKPAGQAITASVAAADNRKADDHETAVECASFLNESAVREYRQLLLSKEINESLTSQLLADACVSLRPEDRQSIPALRHAVASAACSRISRSYSPEGLPGKRAVVFVGPTGVGKTTTLAKLAARLALKHRKKVMLLSLDCYRIGAVEQLKIYAGLIGVPFRFVRDAAELGRAIGECAQRDYILIDTTGYGPRHGTALSELGRFLSSFGEAECHLVMSATTKPRDIPEITSRFECCVPDHLLFSKLDETTTLGPILNELVRTCKPLRYYSDGQRVPEDLHVAPPERLVNLILN